MPHPFPALERIVAYEAGQLDEAETLELFSELLRSGLVWCLQGHYGRTAQALIDADRLDKAGTILAPAEPVTHR